MSRQRRLGAARWAGTRPLVPNLAAQRLLGSAARLAQEDRANSRWDHPSMEVVASPYGAVSADEREEIARIVTELGAIGR